MPFGDRGTVTLSSAKDYSLIVFSWRILLVVHPSFRFSLTGFLSIPIFTLLSAERTGRQSITPTLKGKPALLAPAFHTVGISNAGIKTEHLNFAVKIATIWQITK